MSNQPRQSFAFLPCCSQPWVWIAKPVKSGVKKFICGRSLPSGALSVERPAKNKLRRTIMFSSHPPKPMVDGCGLPNTSPGNDGNDVHFLLCPGTIQKNHVFVSTENIASGDGQSGYGNLFRCKSCWRLASSDTRSVRGRLLQALTSDSAPRLDSVCYHRHRLQKLSRVLKSPRRVFFKERLK